MNLDNLIPAQKSLYLGVDDTGDYLNNKAAQGDNIMSDGISVLYKFMTLFGDLAQTKYDQMNVKADRSRNSQQAANQVDAIIAQLEKADSKGTLPADVIQYLRDNKITITVQNNGTNTVSGIDDYLNQQGIDPSKPPIQLNKGQLDVIKGALETDSGRCSDFVTQSQLQVQKLMQSYNVCVSLINSMQTLLAEMNKSISSNIR